MPFFANQINFFTDLYKNVALQSLEDPLFADNEITLSMLRLDKMHPYISGNKIFKLKYYLLNAIESERSILTFGGPFSNHLVATAVICKIFNIPSIGIVRGERPSQLSHSLELCMASGMKIIFISREKYDSRSISEISNELIDDYIDPVIIPEGGSGKEGVLGASEIKNFYQQQFTHVCCPVGTATTISGLMNNASDESLLGMIITKDKIDIESRIQKLAPSPSQNLELTSDYNFGGYARSNTMLFDFMNSFYKQHQIPTDFVYTGKMMFGIYDLIKKGYFPTQSKILCLHTGGLQGNLSLRKEQLIF